MDFDPNTILRPPAWLRRRAALADIYRKWSGPPLNPILRLPARLQSPLLPAPQLAQPGRQSQAMVRSYSPKQIPRLPAGLPRAGRKWTGRKRSRRLSAGQEGSGLACSKTDISGLETGLGASGRQGAGRHEQDSSAMGGSVPDSSWRREAAVKKAA